MKTEMSEKQKEICMRFSNNLNRLRKEKGLSLKEFENKTGFPYGTVIKLCYGGLGVPHSFTLSIVCDVLECDVSELWGKYDRYRTASQIL